MRDGGEGAACYEDERGSGGVGECGAEAVRGEDVGCGGGRGGGACRGVL